MKKKNKILLTSLGVAAIANTAMITIILSSCNTNENNKNKNIQKPGTTLDSTPSNESKPVEPQQPEQLAFQNEKLRFANNDEVANFFLTKHFNNKIRINNYQGKANVTLDSYQQSNRLWHSNPSCLIDMEFSNVVNVSKDNFNNSNASNLSQLLNGNKKNNWKYNVGSFEAKAGQRYMGNVIIVPMWAPEVYDYHAPTTYSNQEYDGIGGVIDFVIDLIRRYVVNNFDPIWKGLANFLIDSFVNSRNDKLTPNISFNNSSNNELKTIDFGNIKVKEKQSNSITFSANHFLPIIDYREKTACRGDTCSHNIRNLVDVIATSVFNLITDNFGSSSNFIQRFIDDMAYSFLDSAIYDFMNKQNLSTEQFNIIKGIYEFIKSSQVDNEIARYMNRNLNNITFSFLGKLEKHGIQLGKCGNLVSGIKINASENKINITNNDKPFIIFNGKVNKLFSSKTKYNYNTIHCIVELNNYKLLNNFLLKQDLPKNILNILQSNIIKQTAPAEFIYNSYLEYINNQIEPKLFNVRLESFNKFIKEKWVIPDDINSWDILFEYVVPTIFTDKLYAKINGNKNYFFDNYKFYNNTMSRLISNDQEESEIYTDSETYNRYGVVNE